MLQGSSSPAPLAGHLPLTRSSVAQPSSQVRNFNSFWGNKRSNWNSKLKLQISLPPLSSSTECSYLPSLRTTPWQEPNLLLQLGWHTSSSGAGRAIQALPLLWVPAQGPCTSSWVCFSRHAVVSLVEFLLVNSLVAFPHSLCLTWLSFGSQASAKLMSSSPVKVH